MNPAKANRDHRTKTHYKVATPVGLKFFKTLAEAEAYVMPSLTSLASKGRGRSIQTHSVKVTRTAPTIRFYRVESVSGRVITSCSITFPTGL